MLALAQEEQVESLRVGLPRTFVGLAAMTDASVSVDAAKVRLSAAGMLRVALVRPPQTLLGRCKA